MRIRRHIYVLIIIFFIFVFCDANEDASALETYSNKPQLVWELNDQTFETAINSDLIFIMYFVQSAKASSVLRSVYSNAAKYNQPIHPNVKFASLDIESQTKTARLLAQSLGVTDLKQIVFPIFRIYTKGEYIRDYRGKMDASKISGFLTRFSGSGLVSFKDEANLESYLRDSERDSTAVGFFENSYYEEARNFREVSNRLKGDLDFAMIALNSGSLKFPFDKFKRIKKLPSVVVYRNFAPPAFYNTEEDPALEKIISMAEFCLESADNYVEEINKDNIKDEILKRRIPIAIVWVETGDKHKEDYDKYLSVFRQVATRFQKSLAFYWAKGPENSVQINKFGLTGKSFPSVTILDPKTSLHYGYENKTFNRDNLVNFFNDFLSSKIEANMKKEEPPKDNSGPVTTVVYDTFKPLVSEAKHDVVLIFYINDTNCRNILKFYERIAAVLKDYNIEFAKINMDLNDTPRHGIYSVIAGYPTIKYFSHKTRLSETFKEEKVLPVTLLSWVHAQSGSTFDLQEVTSALGYSKATSQSNREQEALQAMQEVL